MKSFAIVVTILGTLVTLGIVGILGMSLRSANHQTDEFAHPVIREQVRSTVETVKKIGDNVEDIRMKQERQMAVLERLSDDVKDIKDSVP